MDWERVMMAAVNTFFALLVVAVLIAGITVVIDTRRERAACRQRGGVPVTLQMDNICLDRKATK